MKVFKKILITCYLLASLHSYAQQGPRVTMSLKNVTLETVFHEIERQTGYHFFCSADLVNGINDISIEVKNMDLESLLNQLFKNRFIEFMITHTDKGSYIALRSKLLAHGAGAASVIDIKGKVNDEAGAPIAGATVNVKGTGINTVTDENGEFSLLQMDPDAVLVVSNINYERKEEPVNHRNCLGIQLQKKAVILEEVIIHGWYNNGYERKNPEIKNYSFSQIGNQPFNQNPGTDVMSHLENQVTGLSAHNPFDGWLIRGRNSINSNIAPLIVLDNFPYDGDVNNINPNDVESITVLKDAAAASIWGARSANGVVVITTKKGKKGGTNISYRNQITFIERPDLKKLHKISAADEVDLENELYDNGFYNNDISNNKPLTPVVEQRILKDNHSINDADFINQMYLFKRSNVYADLEKYAFRPVTNVQQYVSISGGSSKGDFFVSVGWDKKSSNLQGTNDNRFTIRSANNIELSRKCTTEFSLSATFETNTASNNPGLSLNSGEGKTLYSYAKLADEHGQPLPLVKDMSLSNASMMGGGNLYNWLYLPLVDMNEGKMTTPNKDIVLATGLEYRINRFLTALIKYQFEASWSSGKIEYYEQSYFARNFVNEYYQPATNTFPLPKGGIADFSNTDLLSHQGRAQLNFRQVFNRKHAVNAIGGWEIKSVHVSSRTYRLYGYNVQGNQLISNIDFANQFTLYNHPDIRMQIPNPQSIAGSLDHFLSTYGDASYTYDDRYTLHASVRHDATNFFGVKANQTGVPLWSISMNWLISSEKLRHFMWLPYLNLRASFGYNGNFSRDASPGTTVTFSTNDLGLLQGTIQTPVNKNLLWERVRTLNFGVDYKIGKWLTGSIDLYSKHMLDQMSMVPANGSAGLTPPYPTGGEAFYFGNGSGMTGKGMEIELHTKNINRAFTWSTDFLYSYNASKVSKYFEPVPVESREYTTPSKHPIVGKPVYNLYSYAWGGLDEKNGNPVGYIGDERSTQWDDIIANTKRENMIYNGPVQPTHFGSLTNTFTYKKISLTTSVSYKLGYYFRKNSINYFDLYNTWSGHSDYSLRWQHPGDEKTTHVPSVNDMNAPSAGRDFFYVRSNILAAKGDHIRLEYISINYSIPLKLQNKIFKQFELFGYVYNMGVLWTANKDKIDPYFPDGNTTRKTCSAGIRVSFK